MDPFECLGLNARFQIDSEELRSAHTKAGLVWHPDRFALRPESERIEAEDHMAAINEAYAVLRDPIKRAEALLANDGFSMDEGTDTTSTPEFLMSMMELKEEAEEARRSGDAQRIELMRGRLKSLEEDAMSEVVQLFDELMVLPAERPSILEKVRSILQRANYHRRTRESLQASGTAS